jgi:hypothetical protein
LASQNSQSDFPAWLFVYEGAKYMEKKSSWRSGLLGRLEMTLTLFELILSVIFILVGHLTSREYFRGVGVGLLIAGVTSAIAYLYKKKMAKP